MPFSLFICVIHLGMRKKHLQSARVSLSRHCSCAVDLCDHKLHNGAYCTQTIKESNVILRQNGARPILGALF